MKWCGKKWWLLLSLLLWFIQTTMGNWMKLLGDNVGDQDSKLFEGNYLPGSRAEAANWFDKSGKKLWMYSGIGFANDSLEQAHYLKDFWYYDIVSKRWNIVVNNYNSSEGKRQSPVPRKGAAACGVGDLIFVIFGGEVKQNHKLNDTWMYNIKANTWIPLYEVMKHPVNPSPRSHVSSWCLKDQLIIFGGSGGSGNRVLGDMWKFSFKNLTWELLHHGENEKPEASYPSDRNGATTWVNGKNLFLFGGSNASFTTALYQQNPHSLQSDLWKYDLKSKTWVMLDVSNSADTPKTPERRMFASSWTMNNDLYMFGGYGLSSTGFANDFWKYSLNTSTWQIVSDRNESSLNSVWKDVGLQWLSPTQRCSAVMWRHRHVFYLYGGQGYDSRSRVVYLNDLFAFTGESNLNELLGFSVESEVYHKKTPLSPSLIFVICFGSFGGFVFIFCAIFFLKKMIDYPNHAPKNDIYNVKYSPINDEVAMDT